MAPVSHSTSTRRDSPARDIAAERPSTTSREVRDDLDVCAASQRRQPVEFRLADEIVGHEDIRDAGVGHHLGLAELLAIDPFSAEPDLQMRELGDLVGLDVGPQAQSVAVEVALTAAEIVLHDVEIDDRAWRVEVLDQHLYVLLFPSPATGQRDRSRPDKGSIARIRHPRMTLRQPSEALTTVMSAVIVTSSTAPAIVPR